MIFICIYAKKVVHLRANWVRERIEKNRQEQGKVRETAGKNVGDIETIW